MYANTRLRYTVGTFALVLLLYSSSVTAEDEEHGGGEAADAAEWRQVAVDSYYSPKLKAELNAEWMYIIQGGARVTFWGARITGLDDDSPLHDLGVRAGDVITRLDGIRISRNMYRRNGVWHLPELERHYGRTEVRYIITGTHHVKIGTIHLGRNQQGGGDSNPVEP